MQISANPLPNQIKGVGLQKDRLVMTEVDSLETLRLWESQDVQQIRQAYEQTQKVLAAVRKLDQSYRDQSQKEGEVAVLDQYYELSKHSGAAITTIESFKFTALLRADGEARLSTSPSRIEKEDDYCVTGFPSEVGSYPGGEYCVTPEGTWEMKRPKMHAQLDLKNGILSWKR